MNVKRQGLNAEPTGSTDSQEPPAQNNDGQLVGDVQSSPSSSTTSPTVTPSVTPSAAESAAAATGTSTPTPTTQSDNSGIASGSSKSSGTINTGALAGGIVGALIVGLLVGSILGLLWARYKSRRRSRYRPQLEKGSSMAKTPFATTRSVSDSGSDDAGSWQVHLPQPTDDSSLRRSVKTVLHQIDQHVENFYTDNSNESHLIDSSGLAFYETDWLPMPLTEAVRCAQNKKAIIKHCLTHFILTRIDPECQPAHSFLPLALSALPSTIAHPGDETSEAITKDKRVFNEAYSQYRVLAGYLTSPSSTSPAPASHQDHVTAASTHFTTTFAPWLASGDGSTAAAADNLADIIRHAASVGRLLAIQPSRFSFVWAQAPPAVTPPARGSAQVSGFQISPKVVKVTDVRGKELVEGQVLVEGVGVGGGDGRRG